MEVSFCFLWVQVNMVRVQQGEMVWWRGWGDKGRYCYRFALRCSWWWVSKNKNTSKKKTEKQRDIFCVFVKCPPTDPPMNKMDTKPKRKGYVYIFVNLSSSNDKTKWGVFLNNDIVNGLVHFITWKDAAFNLRFELFVVLPIHLLP